jgi:hypothetical protein
MIDLHLPGYTQLGETRRWYLPLPNRDEPARDELVAAEHVGDVAIGGLGLRPAAQTRTDAEPEDVEREVEIEYYKTAGRFIGFSSSWTDNHWGHRERYVPKGSRCNACRWFELRIFRELGDDALNDPPHHPSEWTALYDAARRSDQLGQYVVYKAGMSIVPGEIPYCRFDLITSPYEVVEALTTRKHTDTGPQAFITKPSALALASAARFDDELADAYVNRAVS